MKILVLGIETRILDEGAKNVATNLSKALQRHDDVLVIHQRAVLAPANLIRAIRYSPDAILSMHGPSPKTTLLLFTLRLLCGWPKTIVLATQPFYSRRLMFLLRLLKPGLVFAQSRKWFELFQHAGLDARMLPNGIDLEKFSPCTDNDVLKEVRRGLGVDDNRQIALHIGPINFNRNHELLVRLQRETSWQVIVIGSTTEQCLPDIVASLETSGAKVHVKYFTEIDKVYAAADVYIFPVMEESGSIEFPLTVLEAMACDRPVATYPFRGLADFLQPSESFCFFRSYDELVAALPQISGKTGNRVAAQDFAWDKIAERMHHDIQSLST